MSIFLNNLHHFMGELKLSETQLAKDVGVSQKTISRYIRKGYIPKPDTLIALSHRFGCSVEDLWTFDFEKPDQNHPRQSARRPIVSDREFSYFEGKTLFLYYLKEGSTNDFYNGHIDLDDEYDKQRLYLHGHASTGHEYDVKLVIEDHDSIFIYGIGDNDERRFYIALHYPDFRDQETYTGGVGVLTRLDGQNVFVAMRVVLSDTELDTEDETIKRALIKLLTHNQKTPRVWVNARVNDEFRSGKWLEET